MRTIEKNMIAAINNGKNFRSKNTSVSHDNNETTIRLHGNTIATIKGNKLSVCSAGWKTNTTKSRLNSILSHFNKPKISQKKFCWFIGNEKFNGEITFKL